MAACSASATSIRAACCTPSRTCWTCSAPCTSRAIGRASYRPRRKHLWRKAMGNPDFKMYINLYNILTQKGQRTCLMYLMMTHRGSRTGPCERAEEIFRKIKIPFYTAPELCLHLQAALARRAALLPERQAPQKLLFTGPAHLERPFHQYHDEIIRWYDHWLKGRDTGIMDEPPVRYWVMGANEWRTGQDWPLPETHGRNTTSPTGKGLSTTPPRPAAEVGASAREPDVFTQMPLTRTTKVERLRYMTDPLPHDVTIVGPICLTLYAAIDKTDTNWIVVLKDVGPDVSVRTAREGERMCRRRFPSAS